MIKHEKTRDMKHITQHTFDSDTCQPGQVWCQPRAYPNNHIMSQGIELNQHLLGWEAFLVAFGDAQALLVFFDASLHTATALIIEVDIGQQNGVRIIDQTSGLMCQQSDIVIEIPQIIPVDLWQRVQKRLVRNKILSTCNAKGGYLSQGLVFCGECGDKLADGTKRRYKRFYDFQYRCRRACRYPNEPHPKPRNWSGVKLDWEVWRRVVDYSIKQPHLVREQVQSHQDELRAQGDSVEGEIAHAYDKISEIDSQRTFYQQQAARGKITEVEFDARMNETEETRRYWQFELERLKELRDDQAKIQAGLDYATELQQPYKTNLQILIYH